LYKCNLKDALVVFVLDFFMRQRRTEKLLSAARATGNVIATTDVLVAEFATMSPDAYAALAFGILKVLPTTPTRPPTSPMCASEFASAPPPLPPPTESTSPPDEFARMMTSNTWLLVPVQKLEF
jgi:hypothetical protein